MPGLRALLLGTLALLLAQLPAAAESVVADLSKRLVAITTGFAGTDVLLFGAVEGSGEVVVVVRGPAQDQTVHRKERVAGVWINRDSAAFRNVPAFYAVSSSAALTDILPPALAKREAIGAEYLDIEIRDPKRSAGAPTSCPVVRDNAAHEGSSNRSIVRQVSFCSALIRRKTIAGLYSTGGRVSFLPGRKLFRTTIRFPKNVPSGRYTVIVHVIRDGQNVASVQHPLFVSKSGLEAEVFDFAHDHAPIYGLIAVAIAAFAGWGASQIFRRS